MLSSVTKGGQTKGNKANASTGSTSKGSSPSSSASPSPSRTRKTAVAEDFSIEQANKALSSLDGGGNTATPNSAKERRSARQQTAALAAAAADKNVPSPMSSVKSESTDSKPSATPSISTNSTPAKPASSRPRRGGVEGKLSDDVTNASSTPNGKNARPKRSTTSDSGAVASSKDVVPSNQAVGPSNGQSQSGAVGNMGKDDIVANGKSSNPSEEQRTMKTRSAK